MTGIRAAGIVTLALAVAPASAMAQVAGPPVAQLVKPGQKILVVDEDGREIEGRVDSVSSDALALRADGKPITLALDRIVRIDRPRDGLGNGALIGMGTTVSLSMIGLAVSQSTCESRYHTQCSSPPFWVVLWAAGSSAALGAGIGVGIDAMIHGDRAIYRRGPGVRTAIAPAIARGVRGAAISVSW
jgi:hypothetical protein